MVIATGTRGCWLHEPEPVTQPARRQEPSMFKRPLGLALVLVAVPLFGGVAYAATQSVSSEPSPKVVIPTRPLADDHGGTRNSNDDPATHDVNDDKGGLATTTPTGDDPA